MMFYIPCISMQLLGRKTYQNRLRYRGCAPTAVASPTDGPLKAEPSVTIPPRGGRVAAAQKATGCKSVNWKPAGSDVCCGRGEGGLGWPGGGWLASSLGVEPSPPPGEGSIFFHLAYYWCRHKGEKSKKKSGENAKKICICIYCPALPRDTMQRGTGGGTTDH